ncbi:MAG: AraC family transcriptional regulator [Pseudomonadota bacterium]
MFDAPLLPAADMIEFDSMRHELEVEPYADIGQTTCALVPMEDPSGKCAFVADEWIAGDFYFCESEVLPHTYRIEKYHLASTEHLLFANRFVSGGEQGVFGDSVNRLRPNQLEFVGHTDTGEAVVERSHIQEFYMPKYRLTDVEEDEVPDAPLSPNSVIGKILLSEWDAMFEDLNKTSALSFVTLDRFIACIKIAFGTPAQREDVRAQAREALHQEICRYVERNLGHPDLTTSSILRDFGVSRAGLYRMFEPQGGVRHYITERRAIRAVLELSQGARTRGAVQAAADRWGFSTGPNFNRVIKRMFGAAPGALFQTAPRTRRAPRGDHDLLSNYLNATAAA